MDFLSTIEAAVAATRENYESGHISVDQIRERMKKLSRLKRRSFELQKLKERSRRANGKAERAIERVRSAVADGRPITAFDTGYDGEINGPVLDLGITKWREGSMQTFYLTVRGEGEGHTTPGLFNETTIVMSREELQAVAQQAFDTSDINVFHSAHIDLEKLGLDTSRRYYVDTSAIWRRWGGVNEMTPSLVSLCEHYQIDHEHAHHSGNDSRRTLEVLFQQIVDERPAKYRF